MSVLPVALCWAIGGVLGAFLLPRARRRRLAALVPLAAAIAAAASLGGGPDQASALAAGGMVLGRPASGVLLLSALAATVCTILSPPLDAGGILALGGCGAVAAVAVASGSPLVFGLCFVGGFALLGFRLVTAAPSRASLAAARAATLGAAALAAAAVFLPVDVTSTPPRAHLAGGLLAGGIAAGLAMVPFGGWTSGTARRQGDAAALAPWVLLLVPALLLDAQPLQAILPPASRSVFGFIVLAMGGLTALWSALRAVAATPSGRYVCVLVADLALVTMGLATPEPAARVGSLILLLSHLAVAPLLLQDPASAPVRPRRIAWLAASGVPPSPAFWGRFSMMAALTGAFGGGPLIVAIPAVGALVVAAIRGVAAPGASADARVRGPAAAAAAWLPPLAAVALGLLPDATLRTLLGVG